MRGTKGPEEPASSDDAGSLPDLCQLTTARLAPTRPLAEERRRQIAEHEKEHERLFLLASAVYRAMNVLTRRIQEAADTQLLAALLHHLADLRGYYDELERESEKHERAIERLDAQK